MKHSKKCPQYHLIDYVQIKEQLNNGKVIMVNGPEVWTRPGWMMDWLFSAVLLAYLLVYRKNSGKFPAFSFSGKVTTYANPGPSQL